MAIEVYGAGGANKEAEQKTVTPTTSQQTVMPTDEDHELTQVTVNAMPSGALSDITVSAGRITAQVGTAGYLAAGTKKTMDLSKVPAQSYMPGTSDRVIIPANRYTIGAQTLKGDANLIPENIGKGKSIFGVDGILSSIGSKIWEKYSLIFETRIVNEKISNNPISSSASLSGSKLIVFRNEIHLFKDVFHYKWNGSGWTKLETNPITIDAFSSVVVYDDEIHLLGSSSTTYFRRHYKWNENGWTQLSDIPSPYQAYYSAVVVYNNEIHLLGSTYSTTYYTQHLKWDGNDWTQDVTLPSALSSSYLSAFVLNDELYASAGNKTYKLSNGEWIGVTTTSATQPFKMNRNAKTIFANKLYTFGGSSDSAQHKKVYSFDGSTWEYIGDMGFELTYSIDASACTFDDYVIITNGTSQTINKVLKQGNFDGDYLGLVVGDENDYPDNGEKDGFWYKGYTNYATGTFTTPSGSSQTITLPHNLGKIPSVFAIVPTALGVSSSYECIICVLNNNVVQYKNQYGSKPTVYNNKVYTADEQNITISGYWGGTYTWIAV